MKQLNTIPIENYLDKARIASKSGAKVLTLSITEVEDLANSLAIVMTRLSGELDRVIQSAQPQDQAVQVAMDGGNF
jgi:hypothetical protein